MEHLIVSTVTSYLGIVIGLVIAQFLLKGGIDDIGKTLGLALIGLILVLALNMVAYYLKWRKDRKGK